MCPMIEDLTFRAHITSQEQGLELLKCVQAVVNALGTDAIIALVRAIEKDPNILANFVKK